MKVIEGILLHFLLITVEVFYKQTNRVQVYPKFHSFISHEILQASKSPFKGKF